MVSMQNDGYEVILETTAVLDLYGVFNYITDVLKDLEAAQRVFASIESTILSLEHMPARYNVVKEEPYTALGVRLIPVENYNVFYVVDEFNYRVHVLRVLYKRREWQNLL